MSQGIEFDIGQEDSISSLLAHVIDRMADPIDLHGALSHDVRILVNNHLAQIYDTRHETADKLGAEQTGHWEDPTSYTSEEADSERGTVTIHKAGIGRAAHDVTITPGEGHEWLALPLLAEAYGQRAYRMPDLFFVQPKGKDYALLGRRLPTGEGTDSDHDDHDAYDAGDGIKRATRGKKESEVSWLYLLVTSVLQTQDRSLLPSDDEIMTTARIAAGEYIGRLMKLRGEM